MSRSANAERRDHEAYLLIMSAFLILDSGDVRFFQRLSRVLFDPATDITLTVPRYWALVHLGLAEGRTMAELAQLLLCDKSNVTAIVNNLEACGWAKRLQGKKGDRRFTSVVLTDEGRALRTRIMAAHDEWVRARFAGLTDSEVAQLTALLRKLQSGLESDVDAAVGEIVAGILAQPLPEEGKANTD